MLIIRIKAHLLLIVGNKIVTKKNEEIRFVVGFLCKGNKRQLPAKKKQGFCLTIAFSSPQRPAERYEVVPAYL